MNDRSTAHTTVHPRGDATARVQIFGDGFIGAVRAGEVTIQSTTPAHLRQLAHALNQAASEMVDLQLTRRADAFEAEYRQATA